MKDPGNRVGVALAFCLAAVCGFIGCASPPQKHAAPAPWRFEEGKLFAAGDCFELDMRGIVYEFRVSGEGTVAFPLIVEPVKVSGLSPREVEKLICRLYQPDGPRQSEVRVAPCFEALSSEEQVEASMGAEKIAIRAARKRGWNGKIRTLVRVNAPYQRMPHAGDRWMISVWEDKDGSRSRSAIVMISVEGNVISFTESSRRE